MVTDSQKNTFPENCLLNEAILIPGSKEFEASEPKNGTVIISRWCFDWRGCLSLKFYHVLISP